MKDVMGRPDEVYTCIFGFPVECFPRSMTFRSSRIRAVSELTSLG